MAQTELAEVLRLVPAVLHAPHRYLWSSYDSDADVLYVNFKKPALATDSPMTCNRHGARTATGRLSKEGANLYSRFVRYRRNGEPTTPRSRQGR